MVEDPEDFDYDEWSYYNDNHTDITYPHCHFDFQIDINDLPSHCICCDSDLDLS